MQTRHLHLGTDNIVFRVSSQFKLLDRCVLNTLWMSNPDFLDLILYIILPYMFSSNWLFRQFPHVFEVCSVVQVFPFEMSEVKWKHLIYRNLQCNFSFWPWRGGLRVEKIQGGLVNLDKHSTVFFLSPFKVEDFRIETAPPSNKHVRITHTWSPSMYCYEGVCFL